MNFREMDGKIFNVQLYMLVRVFSWICIGARNVLVTVAFEPKSAHCYVYEGTTNLCAVPNYDVHQRWFETFFGALMFGQS